MATNGVRTPKKIFLMIWSNKVLGGNCGKYPKKKLW